MWPNEGEKLKIQREFKKIGGFSSYKRAIDCTHFTTECPPNSMPGEWRDESHRFSMVLRAIVSPSLTILDFCTWWPGSIHDPRIFYTALLSQNIESRLCGSDLEFSVGGYRTIVPENIIGDAGYMQQVKARTPF